MLELIVTTRVIDWFAGMAMACALGILGAGVVAVLAADKESRSVTSAESRRNAEPRGLQRHRRWK